MVDSRLLELKTRLAEKRPSFVRQDAYHYESLGRKWRRPRGMHSKLRRHRQGKPALPSIGYRSPRAVRGEDRQGFRKVMVRTARDLGMIDPTRHVVLLGHIGTRKRVQLLKMCLEKKFRVANVKDIPEYLRRIDAQQAEKKKKEKKKETAPVQEAVKEKAKPESKEEPGPSVPETVLKQEETKKGQKSEKIKALEKRQ